MAGRTALGQSGLMFDLTIWQHLDRDAQWSAGPLYMAHAVARAGSCIFYMEVQADLSSKV